MFTRKTKSLDSKSLLFNCLCTCLNARHMIATQECRDKLFIIGSILQNLIYGLYSGYSYITQCSFSFLQLPTNICLSKWKSSRRTFQTWTFFSLFYVNFITCITFTPNVKFIHPAQNVSLFADFTSAKNTTPAPDRHLFIGAMTYAPKYASNRGSKRNAHNLLFYPIYLLFFQWEGASVKNTHIFVSVLRI